MTNELNQFKIENELIKLKKELRDLKDLVNKLTSTQVIVKNDINETNKLRGQQCPQCEKSDPCVNGTDGKDGKDGKHGFNGTDGKDGKHGFNGKDGKPGQPGVNGTNGKDCVIDYNILANYCPNCTSTINKIEKTLKELFNETKNIYSLKENVDDNEKRVEQIEKLTNFNGPNIHHNPYFDGTPGNSKCPTGYQCSWPNEVRSFTSWTTRCVGTREWKDRPLECKKLLSELGCGNLHCRAYGNFNIWHFKGTDLSYFMVKQYPHCGAFTFEIMMRIINPGFHHGILPNIWEQVGKQSSNWVKISRTFNSEKNPHLINDNYYGGHYGEQYDDDNEFEFMIALPYISTKC